jgi:hypothetical protein
MHRALGRAEQEAPRIAKEAVTAEAEPATGRAPGFAEATMDDRLREIDAAYATLPIARSVAFVGSPPAPAVDARIASIPGGSAFRHVLTVDSAERLGVARAAVAERFALGTVSKIAELYHAVMRFLADLRDAVFGFRETRAVPGGTLTLRARFDGDLTATLEASAASGVGDALDAAASSFGEEVDRFAASLRLLAVAVEIIATVVKTALSPVHAVRALFRALRQLYDLLTADLASR